MSGAKSYRSWIPEQSFLLPPSPMDWLPEGHLAYFLLDVVGQLDMSPIESKIQAKDARGTRPYSPSMMVALLIYGYCVGLRSSRKIERATHENIAFRVLAGGHHPDHTRISEFRRTHLDAFKGLFKQVLQLCRKAGLVKLGRVAIDGTKVQANASKHKAMSYQRMQELEKRLEKEIEELLEQAEQADTEEDARFGPGQREEDLPGELQRRETRLERLREAKAELEEEARASRAATLRDQARRLRERAAQDPDNEQARKARLTRARRYMEEAKQLDGFDEDDFPPPGAAGELPRHRVRTRPDGTPHPKAQRNFTDPDSRIMESGGTFLQAYNGQAAVDGSGQIIVAEDLTNQCPDNGNLAPMIQQVEANCSEAPEKASADSGFWRPDVAETCSQLGTEVYVATERRRHWDRNDTVTGGEPPEDLSTLEAMRWKLRTEEGRQVYAERKSIVEPVFGQMKEIQGFRRFLLRGLEKARAEWSLQCLTHNLFKLFRSQEAVAAA
ncbi:MAG: IS1182 family transposase [Planctomycetota bacterium]